MSHGEKRELAVAVGENDAVTRSELRRARGLCGVCGAPLVKVAWDNLANAPALGCSMLASTGSHRDRRT